MAEVIDRDLRQRWDALVAAREKQADGLDQELEAVEAELYEHVRDGYHWPLSQRDPRKLLPWRDTAWRVEPAAAEPAQAGGGDLWELRKAEAKDLQMLAIERELADDKAQLEALKTSEHSRGLEVLDPAAVEQELKELEAELLSDLAALSRKHAGPDEPWLSVGQDSVVVDALHEKAGEALQGVDTLPQEASEVLPEQASLDSLDAKSRLGSAQEPTEAAAPAAELAAEYRSAPGVRAVHSIPMWARRGPPSPERKLPVSLRKSLVLA